MKKISCIIPSYNYGRFLKKAIESVFEQTLLPDEIILIDDASIDNTYEIFLSFKKKYPNIIRTYKNEVNLGIIKTFNKAVNLSCGQYILFLGADNYFSKEYIYELSNILDNNSDVGIVYTDFILFGEKAKGVYYSFPDDRRSKIEGEQFYIKFPEFNVKEFENGNFIHGSSMYRRICFDEIGGYLENISGEPEDYNLFKRIINRGWKAQKSSNTFLFYRQHSDEQANIKNIKENKLKQLKKDKEELLFYIEHKEDEIKELKDIILEKNIEIEKFIFQEKNFLKDIEELKREIEHRDVDIEELKKVIEHRDIDIEELKKIIEHRDIDIEELKKAIEHRDIDIEELKKVIEHRR